MLKFDKFTGVNNQTPEYRMSKNDLVQAVNVDIGSTGEVIRRGGYSVLSEECHKNLWQAQGFMLATCGSVLVAIHPSGDRRTIHPALGHSRVWYCNLPDGRTTFTNGLIHGITDGYSGFERGVAPPDSLGVPDVAFGALIPGQYRYHLTFTRLSDRVESPAVSSVPVAVSGGGLRLDGLPTRDGHALTVYLSNPDGEGAYFAGVADGRSIELGDPHASFAPPCRTIGAQVFPVGTVTAFWRGRVLVAQGDVLWASRPMAPHLADWQDFKPMGSRITAVCPVHDGIYVGTDEDLFFLGGETWDQLVMTRTGMGAVVLGSGIAVPGDQIGMGEGTGSGQAMMCIAGGEIVAGFAGGQTSSMTAKRYRTDVKEVWAAFRDLPGVGPQYMALPV